MRCARTSAQERRDLGQAPRRLHRRQALQDLPAIGFRQQARVAQHQHAAIGLVADQAPGALLELQHRLRQLVFHEGIAPLPLHLLDALARCDALLLECNHDLELLAQSNYPARLKARIAGPRGHLSNETAAEILAASRHDGLRHVVAAHLSERNNRPELARAALAAALGCQADDIDVADPIVGFDWRDA